MLTLNHFKSYLYCKQLKWQLKRSQNTSIPIPQTAFWNSQGKGKGGGQGGGGYVLTCRSGNQKAIGWYLWLNCEAIGVSGLGFPEGTDKSVKPWTNWWHYWRLLKAGYMTSIYRSGMCLHFFKKKTITHGLHKKSQAHFKRRAQVVPN